MGRTMKRTKTILNYTNKLQRFISDKIIDIIAVIIALYALQIAMVEREQTQRQFEKSSKSADSLFIVQLNATKQLNQNLINEISKLQKITGNQLNITDRQLEIMRQSLKEQILSERPKLAVVESSISDTNLVITDLFSPIISTGIHNIGKRYADSLRFRPFIIDPEMMNVKDFTKDFMAHPFLEPSGVMTLSLLPKLPPKFKSEFYFCFEISYYDASTHLIFVQSYFYKYYKSRGDHKLYKCSNAEIIKLRYLINRYLESKGDILLKEDFF